jgi:hypothetical protein
MKILSVVFVVVASLSIMSPAQARFGCGIGWHPGPLGHCVRNADTVVVGPRGGVVVVAPTTGRVCPIGWHVGPLGHCRRD